MFDELNTRAEGPRQVLVFWLQQCLVPLGAMIFGFLLLEPIVPRGGEAGLEWPKSMLYAFPGLLGFLQAYIVDRKSRDASRTGRWVGIIPLLYWVYSVSFMGTNLPLSARLAQEFAPSGDTEGLILAIETIPTLACVCYSIQMLILGHRQRVQTSALSAQT